MKIRLIACEVFARELSLAAAESRHIIDAKFLSFGLHCFPDQLRENIQNEINTAGGKGYDYIALGYCLCSRGTADITAGNIPVIIPKAHDCITLLLGSRSRYNEEFMNNPGTYYYSPGWIERSDGEIEQGFIKEKKEREMQERYEEYKARYGEDNAKFLIEQESLWLINYTRAAFINMGIGDIKAYRGFVSRVASTHGWEYEEVKGDMALIRALVSGEWDEKDFLILEPGRRVVESFDEDVIASTD